MAVGLNHCLILKYCGIKTTTLLSLDAPSQEWQDKNGWVGDYQCPSRVSNTMCEEVHINF